MTVQARDKELSLIEHLDELRSRLVVSAIAVAITTTASFFFATQIIRALIIPLDCQWFTVETRSLFPPNISVILGLVCQGEPAKLIALSPTENFTTFFRVALFAGIAFAMPVLVYEIYAYIDPALYPRERRFVRFMGIPVILLFVLGMAFCYFVLLPNALQFLINFGNEVIENRVRASDYLSFVTVFILGVGIVFEMPAIIYALVRVRVVRRSWLARQRRYVFLLVFVIGAIITPTPDPFNQTLVALPMYLLFELGLFLARFAGEPRAAT
jgi:sec-independent protein translocase protein TatC